MAGWETADMVAALPGSDTNPAAAPNAPIEKRNMQELGWAQKTSYNYDAYNKTNKELAEEAEAASGAASSATLGGEADGYVPTWAGQAPVYDYTVAPDDDEYGDIGPRHPTLETKLFNSDRSRSGLDFSVIQSIAVTQEGTIRIDPIRSFDEPGAGLHPIMLNNVKLAGYELPTPIQAYCLPAIKKGHDVVACAQTGSGKTAAYLIPTLSKLMGKAKKLAAPRPNPALYDPSRDGHIRAEPLLLVISPTRELATQIYDEARRFCYRSMLRPCVIYGGGPTYVQREQLAKGCDILIATPGRLIDFIDKPQILSLHRLKYTIIDEADELLQEDWKEEFDKIMTGGNQNEGNINYMMFSATFPKAARVLAAEHLANDHVRIRVGRAGSSHLNIRQALVWVESDKKKTALYDLLLANPPARTMIFVNSRRTADELDDFLFNLDLPSTSVHSDRTQKEREDAIRAFRKGTAPVMITTGVGARGWDVQNVMHVINYDLPSMEHGGIEEYTHRIGRTGRIGHKGLATSFYNDRDEPISEVLTKTLLETNQDIPDFLQQYIPEDRSAPLKFESDEEDEDVTGADAGVDAAAGGWGAPASSADPAGGWGAPTQAIAAPAAPVQNATPAAPGGWGAPTQATSQAAPVDNAPPAAAGGWGAPTPVATALFTPVNNAPPAAAGAWGAPVNNAPPAGGWGAPTPSAAPPTAPTYNAPSIAGAWGPPTHVARNVAPAPKNVPSLPSAGSWADPNAVGPTGPPGHNAIAPVAPAPQVIAAPHAAPAFGGAWAGNPAARVNAAPPAANGGWVAPQPVAPPSAPINIAPPAPAASSWVTPAPAAGAWSSGGAVGGGQGKGWSHPVEAEW